MLSVFVSLLFAQLLLALSMARHAPLTQRLVQPAAPYERLKRGTRLSGFGLLLLSLVVAVLDSGPGLGITWWLGLFPLSGMIVVILLEHGQPRSRVVVPGRDSEPVSGRLVEDRE